MSNNQFLNKVTASYINCINSNLRRTFLHIFPNWKLGRVLNPRYYFSLFESLEHIILLEEQVATLKQQ
jgi:hypothetical protein